MSEVGVLRRHVNRDRLRALVAEGNILLTSAVARRGIAPCGARTCCSARRSRSAPWCSCRSFPSSYQLSYRWWYPSFPLSYLL